MSTPTGHSCRRLLAISNRTGQNINLAISDAKNPVKSLFKKQMALSIRNRSWFKLSHQDRSFYTLALRLRLKFESVDLLRALVAVLKRLQQFGRTEYNELHAGMRLAWMFSAAAVSWGNCQARSWRSDQSYIRFLGWFYLGSRLD